MCRGRFLHGKTAAHGHTIGFPLFHASVSMHWQEYWQRDWFLLSRRVRIVGVSSVRALNMITTRLGIHTLLCCRPYIVNKSFMQSSLSPLHSWMPARITGRQDGGGWRETTVRKRIGNTGRNCNSSKNATVAALAGTAVAFKNLALCPTPIVLYMTELITGHTQTRACGETLRLLEPPVAPFLPAGLCARAAPVGGLTNANPLRHDQREHRSQR